MNRTKRSPKNASSTLARKIIGVGEEALQDKVSFQVELLKEIYRADRRKHDREFGLVQMKFRHIEPAAFIETVEFRQCVTRLRITDSVGWYRESIAFLLPETDKDGVLTTANELTRICIEAGIEVDTEVSIYPDDDELISLADELARQDRDDHDHDSMVGFEPPHQVDGSISESNGAEVNQQVESSRIDQSHGMSGPNAAVGVVVQERAMPVSTNRKKVEPLVEAIGRVVVTKHAFVPVQATPWWKRMIDIAGAGAGLLLLSPVFLAAAIAIKCTSKGPVFFRQMREGKNGKHFGILKFRTMVTDAEAKQAELRNKSEQDGPAFKLTNDPRVTWVGKYLRKSCVDELPQLVNVLTGEMSLVGPRPLPIAESVACKAWQRARLTVLPGLTCTWQAHGGRDVKFEQWMRMDLDYIERRSFLFDLKLIAETAVIALMHRGSV
ncbi:MAG: sugar transferase [Planctomycetota bacterium]